MGKNRSSQSSHGEIAKRLARAAWFLLTGLTLLAIVVHLPLLLETASVPCSGRGCDEMQLAPKVVEDLTRIGTSLRTYAWVRVASVAAIDLSWVSIGTILFIRKSEEWMGLLASLALITFPPAIVAGKDLAAAYPHLELFGAVFETLGVVFMFTLFYIFPNGRFQPRWTRWLWLMIPLFGAVNLLRVTSLQPYTDNDVLAFASPIPIIAFILLSLSIQVYRYLRISTAVERQQTKWVVYGFMGMGLLLLLWLLGNILFPTTNVQPLYYRFAAMAIGSVLALTFPLSILFSILRYRLWDIDNLINRTIVYGAVTTILALTYFGSVLLLQNLFRALTGQDSQLAIVMSTLAIAALFNPLRQRIQEFIDRSFYRQKYDAEQALAQFAATAREEVNIERLSNSLIGVVRETMQPKRVGLWLKGWGSATDE